MRAVAAATKKKKVKSSFIEDRRTRRHENLIYDRPQAYGYNSS
jgi:hypothetical protein